jgi:hypothetical protein
MVEDSGLRRKLKKTTVLRMTMILGNMILFLQWSGSWFFQDFKFDLRTTSENPALYSGTCSLTLPDPTRRILADTYHVCFNRTAAL